MLRHPAEPVCDECGADLAGTGTCSDVFHRMLAMEWEIPGASGGMAHFYAVASYQLQHPVASRLSMDSLARLRESVRVALGGAQIPALRERARAGSRREGRVTRRDGDAIPSWGAVAWTTNVGEIVSAGVDGYETRVESWAASVLDDLEIAQH